MEQNKLEAICLQQGEFEVIITENLYNTIKNVMSTKIDKSKLKNIVTTKPNRDYYYYYKDIHEDACILYIPYKNLGVKNCIFVDIEPEEYDSADYCYDFGVRKQTLNDFIKTHSYYNSADSTKNINEYIYTFYIREDEEWTLKYKYFEKIILKLSEFFEGELYIIDDKDDIKEFINYLNLLKNAIKIKRNDTDNDVVFEINEIGCNYLLNAIHLNKEYLQSRIEFCEDDYLRICYLFEDIYIKFNDDKVIIRGSESNEKYFKVSDDDVRRILTYIKATFDLSICSNSDVEGIILDNMLKLI